MNDPAPGRADKAPALAEAGMQGPADYGRQGLAVAQMEDGGRHFPRGQYTAPAPAR